MHQPFIPLLLITALAALVPLLSTQLKRVRIPIVVGEIVAGMIIGHSGFDLVTPSPTLDFLAEFGFAKLMFLSGLEIDISLLIGSSGRPATGSPRAWTRPLPLSFIMLGLTVLLAYLASTGLAALGLIENPLLVALILSTTSLGVVLPVLKEQHALTSRFGQYVLVASSIADLVTLLLLTVVLAATKGGLRLDLLLVLVLLATFALMVRVAPYFAKVVFLRKIVDELAHATAQVRVRGAFAVMVALVVMAQSLGVEVILGAFLAGAVVGLMAGPESPLREKLDAIGFGFFIPVFFIMVGIRFDLSQLVGSKQSLILVPALVAVAYLVKLLPALLLRTQFSWRETFSAGALLSSRLSLIVAVSAIAFRMGVISGSINASIVLVAVITCTLSPLIFNLVRPAPSKAGRHGVIIVGDGKLSAELAERLAVHQQEVTRISTAKAKARPAAGYRQVVGEPIDESSWTAAGAGAANSAVLLVNSRSELVAARDLAQNTFQIPTVVTRLKPPRADDSDALQHHQLAQQLRESGVRIIEPALAMLVALEATLRFPAAFEAMADHTDNVDMGQALISAKAFHGRTVHDIDLPGNAIIFTVTQADGTVIVPQPDTLLRVGDEVGLIGSAASVESAIAVLEASA